MNLKDGWDAYDSFTAKASTVSRQLAFAGLGVIWLFRSTNEDRSQVIPPDFVLPALLIVLCLAFDLNQYVVAAALWHHRLRKEERAQRNRSADKRANDMRLDAKVVELDTSAEFSVSEKLSRAIDCLWLLKIALIYAAYILLIAAVLTRFFSVKGT